jgi:hypothetical protein
VSGTDFGFRVEGINPYTGQLTGRLVIQVNGEWVEVTTGPTLRKLR